MSRIISATRYLVILPVLGLAIAASVFFVFGGIGLLRLLVELTIETLGALGGAANETAGVDKGVAIFEVVEFVHLFLVGTVLYIIAVGLYQLFVHEIRFPDWLQIDTTEELETNLIGVTVVVLAVNFMGAVLVRGTEDLFHYGAGIALPIAALGLFIGMRAWSAKTSKESASEEARKSKTTTEPVSQETVED